MWREKAKFWRKKFLLLNKQFEVPQTLRRTFNPDQIDMLLGRVRKVKQWSEPSLIRGLQTRFACGKGYEFLRKNNLPYPSTRTLLEHIQSIEFDSGTKTLHQVL